MNESNASVDDVSNREGHSSSFVDPGSFYFDRISRQMVKKCDVENVQVEMQLVEAQVLIDTYEKTLSNYSPVAKSPAKSARKSLVKSIPCPDFISTPREKRKLDSIQKCDSVSPPKKAKFETSQTREGKRDGISRKTCRLPPRDKSILLEETEDRQSPWWKDKFPAQRPEMSERQGKETGQPTMRKSKYFRRDCDVSKVSTATGNSTENIHILTYEI